jgi:hypothetical protein
MRSLLAGKTCHTTSFAKKFINDCIDREVAYKFWVTKFFPGEEEDKDAKILVTFWVNKENSDRLSDVGKTMVLHMKPTGTIFTINALNKLTEKLVKEQGDKVKKDETGKVIIPWEEYKRQFICIYKGNLGIFNTKLLYVYEVR